MQVILTFLDLSSYCENPHSLNPKVAHFKLKKITDFFRGRVV